MLGGLRCRQGARFVVTSEPRDAPGAPPLSNALPRRAGTRTRTSANMRGVRRRARRSVRPACRINPSDLVVRDSIFAEVQPHPRTLGNLNFTVTKGVEFLLVQNLQRGRPLFLRKERRCRQRQFFEWRSSRGVCLDPPGHIQPKCPMTDAGLVEMPRKERLFCAWSRHRRKFQGRVGKYHTYRGPNLPGKDRGPSSLRRR